jgi:hypothetical protein
LVIHGMFVLVDCQRREAGPAALGVPDQQLTIEHRAGRQCRREWDRQIGEEPGEINALTRLDSHTIARAPDDARKPSHFISYTDAGRGSGIDRAATARTGSTGQLSTAVPPTLGTLDANSGRTALNCEYAELDDLARTARRTLRAHEDQSWARRCRTGRNAAFAGDIAFLNARKSGTCYYECPWALLYEVRRPVTINGRSLRVLDQFTLEFAADDMPRGLPFRRGLLLGPFRMTNEVEYCDPDGKR